ncbi:DUF5958 family protein [Amycolatopsis sp. NBC_00438]|uniref:DUF5958 family protein n=1 Tax=Amycolatopsis sp. NBC_00438 TaxID=2903558 RepID=UPI003FA429AB
MRSLDDGTRRLERQDPAQRRVILDELAFYAGQARAAEEDRDEAIARAGIKTGDTAAVLLRAGPGAITRPALKQLPAVGQRQLVGWA